jgi:hypothetical protein
MNILVNNKAIEFQHEDFPMLISGAPGAGSSFFSIELMVNLLRNGEKVIIFSAYEQAKDLFKKEVGDFRNPDALIIESEDDGLFVEQLKNVPDVKERIILYKNIDNYDSRLFDALVDNQLVIYSGNLDKCVFKQQLIEKPLKTKILFSYPKNIEITDKIELSKYCARIVSDKYNGIITLAL